MDSLISIVIPIYNGAKLIKKMVDSILAQTYQNFELILVNDGSKDNTLDVINENYAHIENVHIFNKHNTGVSDTRNYGLSKANGEYIIFLDADDYLDETFLQQLYESVKNNNSDISMCEYYIISENGKTEEILDLERFDDTISSETITNSLIPAMISESKGQESIRGLVWRTLIKKSLISENNLKFNEKIPIAEDLLFLIEAYNYAKSISLVKKPLYHYFRYDGSVLSKHRPDNYNRSLFFHKTLVELLDKINLLETYEERVSLNRFFLYTTGMSNAVRGKRKLSEKFAEYLVFYKSFLDDEYIKKLSLKKVFGKRKIVYIMLKMRLKFITFLLFNLKERCR